MKPQLVRNMRTGQVGLLIEHCKRSVKVCTPHPTIKNAHAYRYWRNIETI